MPSEWAQSFIDSVEAVLAADEAWDHDFLPSPHNPYAIAEKLATKAHIPFLREVVDHPTCGPYARHALAKVGSLSLPDDEPYDDAEDFDTGRDAALARGYRKYLAAPERDIRLRGLRELASAHQPEDAVAVLDAFLAEGGIDDIQSIAVPWLAPLPRSAELLSCARPRPRLRVVSEIVRRRRCAGLTTDAELLRPRVLGALLVPRDSKDRHAEGLALLDMGHAANIVVELADVLGDDECCAALAHAIGPPADVPAFRWLGPMDELRSALLVLGERARRAVEEACARATGEHATRLGWVRKDLADRGAKRSGDVSDADVRFLAGNIEGDWSSPLRGAYAAYGELLRVDPRSGHCAYQLAWIDRAYGTPITPERIAWIRSLGIEESLLDALARRPEAVMPFHRYAVPATLRVPNYSMGQRALRAGLPSFAAKYFGDRWPAERARAKAAAEAHIDQFWK